MTDSNDIVCDNCEEYIKEWPRYQEEHNGWVDINGDVYESLGDFLEQTAEIALYNQEWNTYICVDCVASAYHTIFGYPIRQRMVNKRRELGWWWSKQKRRMKR